jgi:LmbE family N-acetylglucosaminyl deacetylase
LRGTSLKRFALWIGGPAVALALLIASRGRAQFPPAPGTGPGLPETIEAIDGARVTTRILYVVAHPDDEGGGAILTYLARGLHADVALLTLTRGEGGQNDLGPEQAPQLGLIRTQELLAATRGYGVKLFFTRAPDFGFSKTTEETQKIWGDPVLEDMVRVIRTFRPNIVINHFGGVHTGHGHHQTSGLWTPKAVQLAADPNAFQADLAGKLPPWGGEGHPVQILDLDRGDNSQGFVVPVNDISPLWGKSYRQIGLDAFASHRSQGISAFIASPFFRRPIALRPENGGTFDSKALAEPLRSLMPGCRAFEDADEELVAARQAALNLDWAAAAKALSQAANNTSHWQDKCPWHLTNDIAQQFQLMDMNRPAGRIEKALALAAGLQVIAEADRGDLVSGENFILKSQSECRPETGCKLGDAKLLFHGNFKEIKREGDPQKGLQFTVAVSPSPAPAESALFRDHQSQFLLAGLNTAGQYDLAKQIGPLLPEPPPLVSVQQEVTVSGYTFRFTQAATHIQATSTHADRVPLRIVPAYTLAVEPAQVVEVLPKPGKPFDILLRVHSYATRPAKVSVGVDAPQGWQATAPIALDFSGSGDKYARLTVTPPRQVSPGNYKIPAYVQSTDDPPGGATVEAKFTSSLEPLPTLPTQFWSEPAECFVHAFDIRVPDNLRVGYITAESEPVPEALQRLGIRVEMLDPAALAFSDLSRFDAIVVGVRAYELRSDLPGANQRLLEYVSNGGTLVVQYNRDFAWDRIQPAPYHAQISPAAPSRDETARAPRPLPRITDESAAVTFLKPDDPLLNRPNKITQDDFSAWVQERGLYYWTDFDSKYTPLLSMHDPNEPDLNGGLVYTHYGKGTYIYTGLAFFRQLPEGVPGAYRLFINLVSASRNSRASAEVPH